MAGSRLDAFVRSLARRRAWVQAAFLFVWLDPFLLRLHTVCGPVFHCYSCPLATFACPIGVIANFSALHLFPLAALGTLVILGSFIGNAVCGWACPFGFLQDLAGRIPTPRFALPAWTGYAKYVVLVGLVIAVPYAWGEAHPLFFCRLCPAGALEGAIPNTVRVARAGGEVVLPSAVKLTILGGTLALMLFTQRPWCRLFCPLGAIFGIFNRMSLVTLRFGAQACRGCGQCDKMCRYGVLPNRNVNNSRCIRCLECTRCTALSLGTVFDRPTTETAQGPSTILEARRCGSCKEEKENPREGIPA